MVDYKLFFQDVDLGLNLEEYLHSGVHRFLYTRRFPVSFFEENFERIQRHFRNYPCEVAHDRGDHMWWVRPGIQTRAPIWRMDSHDLTSLQRIAATRPEVIFVELFDRSASQGKGLLRSELALTLKKFWEVHDDVDVPMILFGWFNFRAIFQSNISGGAVRGRSYVDTADEDHFKIGPDGKVIYASPLRHAIRLAAKHRTKQIEDDRTLYMRPRRGRKLDSKMIRTIMMLQATPHYQQQYREQVGVQEYDAIKLLPDDLFPENFQWSDPIAVVNDNLPTAWHTLPGDRIMCDTCSLKYRCPLYRRESMCAVPDTEGKSLADYFDTRDAQTVLVGIQSLVAKQAERVEGAVEAEEERNEARMREGKQREYSDQVTKMIGDLQKSAERYVKLIDPRFTKPLVQINQATISGPTPREIDPATAKQELLDMGIKPEQITADMVARYLDGTFNGPRELAAGTGEVIDADDFPRDF